MQTVKKATWERKCREGEWETVYEPNRDGVATVRNTATNRQRMVRVQD